MKRAVGRCAAGRREPTRASSRRRGAHGAPRPNPLMKRFFFGFLLSQSPSSPTVIIKSERRRRGARHIAPTAAPHGPRRRPAQGPERQEHARSRRQAREPRGRVQGAPQREARGARRRRGERVTVPRVRRRLSPMRAKGESIASRRIPSQPHLPPSRREASSA